MIDFAARPVLWKRLLMALGALGFVVISAWIAGLVGTIDRPSLLIGWSGLIFFGACLVAICLQLGDRDDELQIGPAGLRYARWSDQVIAWHAIEWAGTWRFKRQTFLIVKLVDPRLYPPASAWGRLRASNRFLTGGDIAISLRGTDRTVDQAVAAMERYLPVSARV